MSAHGTEAQLLRREVLMQIYGTRPVPLTASLMRRNAARWGESYDASALEREAVFLVGQGLAQQSNDPVTGEKTFAITSQGIIHYEQHS